MDQSSQEEDAEVKPGDGWAGVKHAVQGPDEQERVDTLHIIVMKPKRKEEDRDKVNIAC